MGLVETEGLPGECPWVQWVCSRWWVHPPVQLSWTWSGDDLAMPDHLSDAMPWMRQGLEVEMGARCWPAHTRAAQL
jgi:hypothetical protein